MLPAKLKIIYKFNQDVQFGHNTTTTEFSLKRSGRSKRVWTITQHGHKHRIWMWPADCLFTVGSWIRCKQTFCNALSRLAHFRSNNQFIRSRRFATWPFAQRILAINCIGLWFGHCPVDNATVPNQLAGKHKIIMEQ